MDERIMNDKIVDEAVAAVKDSDVVGFVDFAKSNPTVAIVLAGCVAKAILDIGFWGAKRYALAKAKCAAAVAEQTEKDNAHLAEHESDIIEAEADASTTEQTSGEAEGTDKSTKTARPAKPKASVDK